MYQRAGQLAVQSLLLGVLLVAAQVGSDGVANEARTGDAGVEVLPETETRPAEGEGTAVSKTAETAIPPTSPAADSISPLFAAIGVGFLCVFGLLFFTTVLMGSRPIGGA